MFIKVGKNFVGWWRKDGKREDEDGMEFMGVWMFGWFDRCWDGGERCGILVIVGWLWEMFVMEFKLGEMIKEMVCKDE